MLTYPSTHGVFESIEEACEIVHKNGGQVYIDTTNLNAMVGLCSPVNLGVMLAINLHKTFCIPRWGGPGIVIVCKAHLKEFLPSHIIYENQGFCRCCLCLLWK